MTYTEVRADEIVVGDKVLVKYFDTDGDRVEEDWTASSVRTRKYGKGVRVLIVWTDPRGGTLPESYKSSQPFGRKDAEPAKAVVARCDEKHIDDDGKVWTCNRLPEHKQAHRVRVDNGDGMVTLKSWKKAA